MNIIRIVCFELSEVDEYKVSKTPFKMCSGDPEWCVIPRLGLTVSVYIRWLGNRILVNIPVLCQCDLRCSRLGASKLVMWKLIKLLHSVHARISHSALVMKFTVLFMIKVVSIFHYLVKFHRPRGCLFYREQPVRSWQHSRATPCLLDILKGRKIILTTVKIVKS